MVFNSLDFALFFAIVYPLYLVLPTRLQNYLLLVASYVFYGAWDHRFLYLMFASTVIDYVAALLIDRCEDAVKRWRILVVCLTLNLSLLGFFKYYNFFASTLIELLKSLGLPFELHTLQIILPVGISFYTLQSMSYTIDVYRRRMPAVRSLPNFALYVSFFPQLVAGPIERATQLYPQIASRRVIEPQRIYQGVFLIFWGLFQKMFVADNLGKLVHGLLTTEASQNGVMMFIVCIAFAFQLLCDFEGYSNIARGLANCMGFELAVNFRYPYFSTNPQQFWNHWHITLMSWLRDYLFFPLGGFRGGRLRIIRNIYIVFFLVGLWHGASWTFVLFGLYHGTAMVLYQLLRPLIKQNAALMQRFRFVFTPASILLTFLIVSLSAPLFIGNSLSHAASMYRVMLNNFHFDPTYSVIIGPDDEHGTTIITALYRVILFSWVVIAVHFAQYRSNDTLVVLRWHPLARGAFYLLCFYLLILLGSPGGKEYIYFQF